MQRNSHRKRTQQVEKPRGTFKTALQTMICEEIWSHGHQRVEMHQNSLQKRAQGAEKPLGTVKTALQTMICDMIVSWVSTCRGAPE